MMDEKIFQKIFDELNEFLTPDWIKLIVYLEYGKGSYTYSFYEKGPFGYINGYDLPDISERTVDNAFKRINKLVLKERTKHADDLWTNMTMIVNNSGEMHSDFDYTDLSDGAYKFKKKWKEHYLI